MAPPTKSPIKTIEIDNFSGILTRINDGSVNSGFAKYSSTFGIDSFTDPKQLKFMETAIDITGAVITDCIVAMKAQVENGTIFVYAIGHMARLYKIQVNNINTFNPVVDTAVLLTTLTINSPTFQYGASLDFATTTQLYIGSDKGVTSVNTDGSGEAFIGSTGSWVQNVPRQSALANGSFYYTNGDNIAIVQSGSVITYTALSPGFATNYVTRDLEVTSDFNYLVILATTAQKFSLVSDAPDTNSAAQSETIIGYWNFTPSSAITTALNIPSFTQTAYHTFGSNEFFWGYDSLGNSVSTPTTGKILTMSQANSPLPNSVGSQGNFLVWATPQYNNGLLKAAIYFFGQLDSENQTGLYRQLLLQSATSNADILQVGSMLTVSNLTYSGANQGYSTYAAFGRMYFSTIEYNGAATTYHLYTFYNTPVGTGTAQLGVYETQTELFSKKVQCKEYRVYMNPASSTSFKIDLIGIDGAIIPNTTHIFAPASTDTMLQFNPQMQPVAALGVRITNVGSVTPIISKIEIDVVQSGK